VYSSTIPGVSVWRLDAVRREELRWGLGVVAAVEKNEGDSVEDEARFWLFCAIFAALRVMVESSEDFDLSPRPGREAVEG